MSSPKHATGYCYLRVLWRRSARSSLRLLRGSDRAKINTDSGNTEISHTQPGSPQCHPVMGEQGYGVLVRRGMMRKISAGYGGGD
jgi:hypothetical protein